MTVARDFILRLVSDPNEIVRCRSPQQKPFLRVHFDSGEVVELPFSLIVRLTSELGTACTMQEVKDASVIPLKTRGPNKRTLDKLKKEEP